MRASAVAAGIALALALAGCSINRHSDDLRCTLPGDCLDGRVCLDGYCVFTGDTPDASPVDADPRCPSVCTSCSGLWADAGGFADCYIDCSGTDACDSPVHCPDGMNCTIVCNGTNACDSGVDCDTASGCTITCTGTGACNGGIECGPGPCAVSCDGNGACDNGVDCGPSCACDVDCRTGNSCGGGVICTGSACEDPPMGCSSTADPTCNTCN